MLPPPSERSLNREKSSKTVMESGCRAVEATVRPQDDAAHTVDHDEAGIIYMLQNGEPRAVQVDLEDRAFAPAAV
jgi:hypothetical protein